MRCSLPRPRSPIIGPAWASRNYPWEGLDRLPADWESGAVRKKLISHPINRQSASAVAVDPGRRHEHRGAALFGHHAVVLVPVVVSAAAGGEHFS